MIAAAWLGSIVAAVSPALPVIASVVEAREAGDVVVLDARAGGAFAAGHIPGAQRVDWTDYRNGLFLTGRLTDDVDRIASRLAALGVDDATPVLVCGGGSAGWGDEGRIAWMLRYLGHARTAVLDGGCDAWRAAALPWTSTSRAPRRGDFHAVVQPHLRATKGDVVAAIGAGPSRMQIVDARSQAEFEGATPYLEARGGHVPGARSLDVATLYDATGRALRGEALAARIAAAGIDARVPMIVYCTAGVRSAMVVEILSAAGLDARNYDGSMWEWAADEHLPLVEARR